MNFLPVYPTQRKICAQQTAHIYFMMKVKIEFIRRHQFRYGFLRTCGHCFPLLVQPGLSRCKSKHP